MQRVLHTLFRALGRKGGQTMLPYFPSSRLFVAVLATVSVGSLLSHSAAAQESAQSPTTATLVRQPLSPEVLALHLRAKRAVPALPTAIDTADATAESINFNSAQGPGPGPLGPGPGCNLFPAVASVGSNVPITYFGPPPSSVNNSLVGPVQLLNSGVVDSKKEPSHYPCTRELWLAPTRRFGIS